MIKFFENHQEIIAVMSEREDGSMKLFTDSSLNMENREGFFDKIGVNKNKVISAEVVQGARVEIVDKSSPRIVSGTDGLVTREKDIFLSITVADCIPVFFYEPEQKIIAIAHCGWRGIVGGIIENTIKKILEVGGKSENLKIALGSGIGACHFEIKEEVLDKFKKYPDFIERRNNKIFIDLKGIIGEQLNGFKVASQNIENNGECTMENDRYFSFRRDKPEKVEAMVAIIGIN